MQRRNSIQALLAPWIITYNFLVKIYVQRGLIRSFVVRDLKSRYVGSLMGLFWSVIHPVVLLISYSFVFSIIFGMRPLPDSGTTSFPVFLFCSILPWLFFQDSLQRSSTVIVENSNLVNKTLFPTEILPLTVVLAALVNHIIGFAILMVVLLAVVGEISIYILFVPVYLGIMVLFTLGLAWLVASLNVFVRDVSQVLGVLLTFWFWFTPIFYSAERFPGKLLFLVHLNPMAHIVIGYRDCLLRMRMPDLSMLGLLALAAAGIFTAGGLFFRYTKREFVDIL